jgi:hypothetical protein
MRICRHLSAPNLLSLPAIYPFSVIDATMHDEYVVLATSSVQNSA